jgi:hypothetical protein
MKILTTQQVVNCLASWAIISFCLRVLFKVIT